MKTRATKLSAAERRDAIVKAVREVFAEKGFHGTTTRELARAAGVSEALLFKHFPSKEALYAAMHQSCCDERKAGEVRKILALPPSTCSLVLMVHYLLAKLGMRRTREHAGDLVFNRLMLQSLTEDGDFARVLLKQVADGWGTKFEECLKAAAEAGEVAEHSALPRVGGWFVHHLAVALMLYQLPAAPVIPYGVSREQLLEQAVLFALRGIGLREDAIRRYYNPQALELFDG